ncbi:MAG TPA: right-handed parallel beta-helix repeat-containing protein [Thermoanaerobaculia bacterium]|nr:right-handed parallel beta-helix repeat-containing protein [Thermoanaerobaculia bacterium]
MRRIALPLAAFLLCCLVSASAHAQATRTWVSGVGDDANPCSRTAPCKTFAGAISKTATGGEINVLDPGGFGGVTITKSITISSEGFEAGVLVSGTNAIIINALTTSTVVLRGLDIEGLGTGLDGIKVLGGLAALHVEKCTINNFRGTNGSGIEVATTTAGTTQVFITDTIVRNSGQGAVGGGILINPTGAGVIVKASLDNVRLEQNTFGLKVNGNSTASVSRSVAAGNQAAGFSAGLTPAVLNITDSVAANNGTGVVCAASTSVRMDGLSITGNGTAVTPGACSSFLNNHVDGTVSVLAISPANQ